MKYSVMNSTYAYACSYIAHDSWCISVNKENLVD